MAGRKGIEPFPTGLEPDWRPSPTTLIIFMEYPTRTVFARLTSPSEFASYSFPFFVLQIGSEDWDRTSN